MSVFSLLVSSVVFAGRAEIKWVIAEGSHQKLFDGFALSKDEAAFRRVYFYDTMKLKFFGSGVILRARKVKDDDDDSTIKIRPLDSKTVDPSWFEEKGFKCEVDIVATKSTDSCSVTRKLDVGKIDEVAAHKRTLDKLFTDSQEKFLRKYSKVDVKWNELKVLGAIPTKVWKFKLKQEFKVTLEEWTLIKQEKILELSTKTELENVDATKTEIESVLKKMNIQYNQSDDSKTKRALLSLTGSRRK